MIRKGTYSGFDKSGLAVSSDLETAGYKELFHFLEERQAKFLERANDFRSEAYKWPEDPLHCWSRIWEYPYAFHHLANYVKSYDGPSRPLVADIGSGVTFFPFSLAAFDCEVICADIDPVCEADIGRAKKVVDTVPGDVSFRLVEGEKLPFDDEECDALYCISVLEHIPDFENTLREMARVLKTGGMCLLTCDLDLDPAGTNQLNMGQFERLNSTLDQYFDFVYADRTVHPLNVLTTKNSPFAERYPFSLGKLWKITKQKIIKPILGRNPGRVGAPPIAVLGLVLRKR